LEDFFRKPHSEKSVMKYEMKLLKNVRRLSRKYVNRYDFSKFLIVE